MPHDKIFWYVLFVRTNAEDRLVEKLRQKLDEDFRPFVLKKTCVFRRQGEKSLFQKICFPGYVFIESAQPPEKFIEYALPIVHKLKDAYRFLCYGDGDENNIAMQEEERVALSSIFGADYCINISTGFKEGDAIKIVSGALVGKESTILKINKNRSQATIAIGMFGTIVPATVGIELIEKVNN